jgi:hypothetical protein
MSKKNQNHFSHVHGPSDKSFSPVETRTGPLKSQHGQRSAVAEAVVNNGMMYESQHMLLLFAVVTRSPW